MIGLVRELGGWDRRGGQLGTGRWQWGVLAILIAAWIDFGLNNAVLRSCGRSDSLCIPCAQ